MGVFTWQRMVIRATSEPDCELKFRRKNALQIIPMAQPWQFSTTLDNLSSVRFCYIVRDDHKAKPHSSDAPRFGDLGRMHHGTGNG
jgi:hypothetical protein